MNQIPKRIWDKSSRPESIQRVLHILYNFSGKKKISTISSDKPNGLCYNLQLDTVRRESRFTEV